MLKTVSGQSPERARCLQTMGVTYMFLSKIKKLHPFYYTVLFNLVTQSRKYLANSCPLASFAPKYKLVKNIVPDTKTLHLKI
jgi:hypothetical protein